MDSPDKVTVLTELLHRADTAHRSVKQSIPGKRPDSGSCEWFAEYLIGHGLDLVMEDRLATELLVSFIERTLAEHSTSLSGESWEAFTARKMVEKLA